MGEDGRFKVLRVLGRTATTLGRASPAIAMWAMLLLVLPALAIDHVMQAISPRWAPEVRELLGWPLILAFQVAVVWATSEALSGNRPTTAGGACAASSQFVPAFWLSLYYFACTFIGFLCFMPVLFLAEALSSLGEVPSWWIYILAVVGMAPMAGFKAHLIPMIPARIVENRSVEDTIYRGQDLGGRAFWRLYAFAWAYMALWFGINRASATIEGLHLAPMATLLLTLTPQWLATTLWAALTTAIYYELRGLPERARAPATPEAALAAS